MPKESTLINSSKSLLLSLKALRSPYKILKLPDLINHCSFENIQLRSVIYLFPIESRFTAFKILVKHFKINLDNLKDLDREKLITCLSLDPSFNNLLPFQKKNFGRNTFVHDVKNNNPTPRINKLLTINEDPVSPVKIKQNNISTNKKVNYSKLTLSALRLSLIKEQNSALRLDLFQSLKKNNKLIPSVFEHMNLEEFINFIVIFPPNDAIKFLNLLYIQNSLLQQKDQLSEDSFIDLLNDFKFFQHDAVMKLLRPISANIDIGRIRHGLFKEKNTLKQQQNVPDILANCVKIK